MDHNFREMGVGDLAVPKEMKRVAEAFYGRAGVYEAALAADDRTALEAAVARNVFGMEAVPLGARRLAAYMDEAARQLATQISRGGQNRISRSGGRAGQRRRGRNHERTRAPQYQAWPEEIRADAARRARPSGPGAFRLPVAEIPATGRRVELTADAATCEAVAKAAGVVALPRLEAVFDLAPLAERWRAGFRLGVGHRRAELRGHARADDNEVEEHVDLILVQPGRHASAASRLDIDVAEETIRRMCCMTAPSIWAPMATEFLMLGIDPYPRKPGASFEAPTEADDPAAHPFAALAALKKDSGAKPALKASRAQNLEKRAGFAPFVSPRRQLLSPLTPGHLRGPKSGASASASQG